MLCPPDAGLLNRLDCVRDLEFVGLQKAQLVGSVKPHMKGELFGGKLFI